jgi:hypothetical protein
MKSQGIVEWAGLQSDGAMARAASATSRDGQGGALYRRRRPPRRSRRSSSEPASARRTSNALGDGHREAAIARALAAAIPPAIDYQCASLELDATDSVYVTATTVPGLESSIAPELPDPARNLLVSPLGA